MPDSNYKLVNRWENKPMISNYVSSDWEAGESFRVFLIVGNVYTLRLPVTPSGWRETESLRSKYNVWMLAFRYDAARHKIHIISWWINNQRVQLYEGIGKVAYTVIQLWRVIHTALCQAPTTSNNQKGTFCWTSKLRILNVIKFGLMKV